MRRMVHSCAEYGGVVCANLKCTCSWTSRLCVQFPLGFGTFFWVWSLRSMRIWGWRTPSYHIQFLYNIEPYVYFKNMFHYGWWAICTDEATQILERVLLFFNKKRACELLKLDSSFPQIVETLWLKNSFFHQICYLLNNKVWIFSSSFIFMTVFNSRRKKNQRCFHITLIALSACVMIMNDQWNKWHSIT